MGRHTSAFQLLDIFSGRSAVQPIIKALIKLLIVSSSSPTPATTTQHLSLEAVPLELLEVLPVDRQILQGGKIGLFEMMSSCHMSPQALVGFTLELLTHLFDLL